MKQLLLLAGYQERMCIWDVIIKFSFDHIACTRCKLASSLRERSSGMEQRGRQECPSLQSVLSALPYNSCVSFGKSLKLSEPQFHHLIPALLNLKG